MEGGRLVQEGTHEELSTSEGLYRRLWEKLDANPGADYRLQIMCGMAWKAYDAAASRFGLSPADRAHLRTEPPKKTTSKWEGLLA